jgi:hypothetical protein
VTRKLGIPSFTVSRPLTNPKATPTAMAATAPSTQTFETCWSARADTIPDSAKTLPTERSMWALTMTSVTPTAMMDTIAVCRPTLAKFCTLKKTGEAMEKKSTRPTSAMYTKYSRTKSMAERPPHRGLVRLKLLVIALMAFTNPFIEF